MAIYLNEYFKNYMDNNFTKLDGDNYTKLEMEICNSIKKGNIVYLDFDGGFGYTTNFIEMIVTFIIDKFGREEILKKISIISNDEPSIAEYVFGLLKK